MRQKVVAPPLKEPRSLIDCKNNPELLAKHVFDGELTLRHLFLHHTVAPIYLSLIKHKNVTDVTEASRSVWHRAGGHSLSAYSLRFCTQCVQEDTAQFGCGHWRREHQIRSVRICTKHLTVLQEKCATPHCGATFHTTSEILPGQPCPICHGTETFGPPIGSISAGYLAYCKLFTDALHMRIPELDPDNQQDLCTLPNDFSGGDVHAFSSLLKSWLGGQWSSIVNEWDTATYFLRDPLVTRLVRFIAPSLILLAAFKRDMFGPPTYYETTPWSPSPD